MANSLNKVTLIGHLGADPETKFAQNGNQFSIMSLATSEQWRNKETGEKQEKTEWHRIVVFNDALAKLAEKYLRKGSKIYIEGQLATRKWTDDKDIERYTTEVVLQGYNATLMLLDKATNTNRAPNDPGDYGFDPTRATAPAHQKQDDDDDIPF